MVSTAVKAHHGTLLYAGSIPARSTRAASSPARTSCEAGAVAIPPRLRWQGGAISEEDSMIIGIIVIGVVAGVFCFLVTAIGQG